MAWLPITVPASADGLMGKVGFTFGLPKYQTQVVALALFARLKTGERHRIVIDHLLSKGIDHAQRGAA